MLEHFKTGFHTVCHHYFFKSLSEVGISNILHLHIINTKHHDS